MAFIAFLDACVLYPAVLRDGAHRTSEGHAARTGALVRL